LTLSFCLFFAVGSLVYAQSVTSGTQQEDKTGAATLDNHRPLIQKKEKAPTTRTVSGSVTDDTGQPLEGALVSLTDLKTSEKRTFFTKKDGRYQFEDLAFTQDYEVQAKWKAYTSPARKLSQYDHTAKVVRLLQVNTPEGYAASPAAPKADAKKEEPKN
jgi:hypothetical protein